MPKDGKDEQWDEFIDKLRGDIYKGAYFVVMKDGNVLFGCTEENKLKQERLLYRLKNVIKHYIDNYPDFDEMEDMADIISNGDDEDEEVE